MRIINNIINIMNRKGITAYKLCKDTGISPQTFSNWKNGKQAPVDRIDDIIKYLGISPNEVFGYDQTRDLLNEPQKEMISIMEDMDEREQWKAVGIIENFHNNTKEEPEQDQQKTSSSLKIG